MWVAGRLTSFEKTNRIRTQRVAIVVRFSDGKIKDQKNNLHFSDRSGHAVQSNIYEVYMTISQFNSSAIYIAVRQNDLDQQALRSRNAPWTGQRGLRIGFISQTPCVGRLSVEKYKHV